MKSKLRVFWVLFAGMLLGACKDELPAVDPLEADLARERAATHFEEGREGEARQVLEQLVESGAATPEDLIDLAALEFGLGNIERTLELLARVEALEPRSPGMHYLRGQMAKEQGEFEEAERHLRITHVEVPLDLPTRLELAGVLRELDRLDEAEALFRSVIDVGLENGLGSYVSAVYQLQRILLASGRTNEAEPLIALSRALQAQGFEPTQQTEMRIGTFGRVEPPAPRAAPSAAPVKSMTFESEPVGSQVIGGVRELHAIDLDGDGVHEVVAVLADGLATLRLEGEQFVAERIFEGEVQHVRAIALDNSLPENPPPDYVRFDWTALVIARGNTLQFLLPDKAWNWTHEPRLDIELPAPPSDLIPVDFDHDGDMDLFVVGPFGARLYRNDGADEPEAGGVFTDASEEAQLPTDVPLTWCFVEDFDNDNDVDLLAGGPGHVYLGDSLRGGRFADQSARIGGLRTARRPLVADINGDGRTDIVVPGAPLVRWMQAEDGSFVRTATTHTVPADAELLDLDLDGALDVVWGSGAVLALSLAQETRIAFEEIADVPLVFGEFTGDRRYDFVAATSAGLRLFRSSGTPHGALRLMLRGSRDNLRATGSRVTLRAGSLYRRVYYRGEPLLVGAGGHGDFDVVRVHWPNGGVQSALDVPLGDDPPLAEPGTAFTGIVQVEKQAGSCPFLYTWNGETFEFITDVLGITPLGLPIAPGVLVPPDHDEYVLVRGDQLVPKDGELVMQITEELREVTYLDRMRLHAIDRPADVEVFPNERFCFPPFPEHHIHTVHGALAPTTAIGSDGRDWTSEVTTEDAVHAVPFVKEPLQYAGLAKPWFLELTFDPAALAKATKLRLVMTGWFYWSDASANMASARHPRIAFVPPILQLPDGTSWRDTGPPVGFPAGKTKTMVLDVTHLLDDLRADPRLRVFSTLQLYWDRIALAVDDDDAPYVETVLEPSRARLYERGFSEMIDTGRADSPEVFDWDRVEVFARWDPHPGLYTKLGDCLELLMAVDDRYVIFGAGDALEVAFDADGLPPLRDGFVRDWLVFFDGWAKDRDPNTVEALEVEPLPFHGMSGYPYRADEHFPDTEEHRRWRAEWNTRSPRRWIAPLEPALIESMLR